MYQYPLQEAVQTARGVWLNIQEPEKYFEYIQSKISDSTFISVIIELKT